MVSDQMDTGIIAGSNEHIGGAVAADIADYLFEVRRTYLSRSACGLHLFCQPIIHVVIIIRVWR
jgi:hypothetical protein